MPLFRRCDGDLAENIDPMRYMIPLLMRERNQSLIFHTTEWEVSSARSWLRVYNRSRRGLPHATLFHLAAYACNKLLHARPGLNRFVSGGRIYQRKDVSLSFAVKTRFTDDGPLKTVKLKFDDKDTFDACVDRISTAVHHQRTGGEDRIEREVRFLTRLPLPLLRTVLAAGRVLDRINLLPASLIEPDPMYTSMFLANLGSIHIGNAYHHLYEYGTCSLFGVVGGVRKTLVVNRSGHTESREVLQAQWTFDERVNDGFYCVESLEILRRVLEEPDRYVETSPAPVSACAENSPVAAGF